MAMRDKIENGLFNTSEIDLVATLSVSGYEIQDVAVSKYYMARVVFSFEATEDLMDFVASFRRGEVTVEPRDYYLRLRDVRAQINEVLDKVNNQ